MSSVEVLHSVDDLTHDWLTRALGAPVRSFTVGPIGTGQVSGTFRIVLDWDGDASSVVLKIADADPSVRATGVSMGIYEREVAFYGGIAGRLPSTALPRSYVAEYDDVDGWFTLLLEDGSPAHPGDQIVGCSPEEARKVVIELARLQASVHGDPELAATISKDPVVTGLMLEMLLPLYYERFGTRIDDTHRPVVDQLVQSFDTWAADRSEPRGLAHSDFRLDNILFGEEGAARDVTIVDWATLEWGPLTKDLSFFIGGNLTVEDRRAHEKELVTAYHDELVANGVKDFSFDQCWRGYRLNAFSGVLMAIGAPMVVVATERGDKMFMTMLSRHCQQVLDLDALTLLHEIRTAAIQVDPNDEARHEPGIDQYWNESYYLDAISADGTIGAYVRAGFVPKLNRTVYTAYVVGVDRPSVGVLAYEAPLPTVGNVVETDEFTSDLVVEEPLKKMRATLAGTGQSYDDPAAALRDEAGEPVHVEMDLVWETDGEPYMYQVTSRYEMPCRVTGTITIGDEVLTLDGPGQRDHSWGPRDWWSMDWTWASAHLEDETRMQTIELRFPGMTNATVGYEQDPKGLTEINGMGTGYQIPESRMPGRTIATLEPTGTSYEWEPIAYGPLRIEAPDGRVCEFPRAMARVTTSDGRTGLGWIEWGHNVVPTKDSDSPVIAAAQRFGRTAKERATAAATRAVAAVPGSAYDGLMNSRAGRPVTAAIFKALPGQINRAAAEGVDALIRFKVTDAKSGGVDVFDLTLPLTGAPTVARGIVGKGAPDARLTLMLSSADLMALATNRIDATEAALTRRIVVEGDLHFVPTFAALMAKPAAGAGQTQVGHID
ncbi:phosphotransferase [Nocardioides sp. WS12]|uniref:DUF7064 domain-containing protein n=1 Tax=Nocardioides sp. WS12 TaxID=2486272 RepID=UPI0015F7C0E4|nr:phosphotransferase [Nocardioides sp. WS12]